MMTVCLPDSPAAKADVTKSKTDASKLQEASQGRLLTQSLNATTPAPAVSALPNTPTPQPRATGVRGRGGPIAVPASKSDNILVSEYDLMSSTQTRRLSCAQEAGRYRTQCWYQIKIQADGG